MNILKMLKDLRAEVDRFNEAIVVLERLAAGRGNRRGRKPNWMKKVDEEMPQSHQHKKYKLSAKTRKRMAKAQKQRWAAMKRAK